MSNRTTARLRDRRASSGETLTETLVAMLVCTLSIAALMTATLSATRMDSLAKQSDARLNAQRQAAESCSTDDSSDYATATKGSVTLGSTSYDVTYYGGSDIVGYE